MKKYRGFYLCPCCNYPTLGERGVFEICPLCYWEDDGQDDFDADQIKGGPNSDYSLTEARKNFKDHLTMYRPSDRAFKIHRQPDKLNLKLQITKMHEKVYAMPDSEKMKDTSWTEVKRLEEKL